MDAVISLLKSLGINQTLFFQMAIFLIVFGFLWTQVFNKFSAALEERQRRTTGSEDYAEDLKHQAAKLETEFKELAREGHAAIGAIFSQAKQEASSEAEKVISLTKKECEEKRQKHKMELAQVEARVRGELILEHQNMVQAITKKILG